MSKDLALDMAINILQNYPDIPLFVSDLGLNDFPDGLTRDQVLSLVKYRFREALESKGVPTDKWLAPRE